MPLNALLFVSPETQQQFGRMCLAGASRIVELDRWASDLWFRYGICLLGDNHNFLTANDDRQQEGPEPAA